MINQLPPIDVQRTGSYDVQPIGVLRPGLQHKQHATANQPPPLILRKCPEICFIAGDSSAMRLSICIAASDGAKCKPIMASGWPFGQLDQATGATPYRIAVTITSNMVDIALIYRVQLSAVGVKS